MAYVEALVPLCRFQVSVTAGTIFQDTRKPLTLWFRAMWGVTSQKLGMSALGLKRELGLGSYRTAWTWLHKLRRAMVRPGRDRLSGTVEVDEIYIGGVKKGKRGRGADGKALVLYFVSSVAYSWSSLRASGYQTKRVGRCRSLSDPLKSFLQVIFGIFPLEGFCDLFIEGLKFEYGRF